MPKLKDLLLREEKEDLAIILDTGKNNEYQIIENYSRWAFDVTLRIGNNNEYHIGKNYNRSAFAVILEKGAEKFEQMFLVNSPKILGENLSAKLRIVLCYFAGCYSSLEMYELMKRIDLNDRSLLKKFNQKPSDFDPSLEGITFS